VRATSAEATETRHGAAAWRLWRPWHSGRRTAFVAEVYVVAMLEFVYIFQVFIAEGARRV
jgi:hypothetical protein